MRSTRTLWWVPAALAVGWVLAPPCGGPALADQPQATTIGLTMGEPKSLTAGYYGFAFDEKGLASCPFANSAGKLTFQLADGKLRADTNGDGKIDDKDAPAIDPKDTTLRVAMKLGSKQIQFPLRIRLIDQPKEQKYLLVQSAGVLEGTLGKATVRLYSNMFGGGFGQSGSTIEIITAGEVSRPRQWSRTLILDGKIVETEFLADGPQLKLTPYTGPVARLKLEADPKFTSSIAMLVEAIGERSGEASTKEPGLFVPGKYRLQSVQLHVTPSTMALYGYTDPKSEPIELKAGENTLKVGPPMKMDFTAGRKGEEVEFTAVALSGSGGETYRPYPQPNTKDIFAAYIRANGREQELCKLAYG